MEHTSVCLLCLNLWRQHLFAFLGRLCFLLRDIYRHRLCRLRRTRFCGLRCPANVMFFLFNTVHPKPWWRFHLGAAHSVKRQGSVHARRTGLYSHLTGNGVASSITQKTATANTPRAMAVKRRRAASTTAPMPCGCPPATSPPSEGEHALDRLEHTL